MNEKLISIAMCSYNGEKYIKEQLDSIVNQTYKNIEIIITDDCSNDNTVKIIQEYQKNDTRIKLHQNKTNLGFLKNFEYTISLCTGDYIALADQDDVWKKQKLKTFIENIKDNVLIYSDAIIIDKDSNEVGAEFIRPGNYLCDGSCNKLFFLINVVSGNTLMFKRELIQYILPIPKNITYHDSWIAFVASTYGTITYTTEAMTYYRRYSEQVTHAVKKVHKNFFQKLKHKKELKIQNALMREKELKALRTLSILKDEETVKLLDALIYHYENYSNIYFNVDLYKELKKHSSEIFASIKPKKHKKLILRNASGLKIRTSTMFLL